MALEDIDPYPWFLNKPLDHVINEQRVVSRITSSEWADLWRPFLGRVYDLWLAQRGKRFLIAFAGPPGSGKSVLAEQLHWIIDKGFFHRSTRSAALPMDGFHFPNAYLDTHFRKLADGSQIPLAAVKGQPDTIDVPRLRKHIQALVDRPESVPWPGYSRFTHDVVPEKFHVHVSTDIVVIEGNYLLINVGPYAGISELFSLRAYVEAPAPKIIANLVERHIRGGKTLEEAKAWVRGNDLPNARAAESTRGQADVIFERDSDDNLTAITWRGDAASTVEKTEVASPPPPASLPPPPAPQPRPH